MNDVRQCYHFRPFRLQHCYRYIDEKDNSNSDDSHICTFAAQLRTTQYSVACMVVVKRQVQTGICRSPLHATPRSDEHTKVVDMRDRKPYSLWPLLNIIVSVASCRSDGRLFQAARPQKQKPLLPNLVLVLGRPRT